MKYLLSRVQISMEFHVGAAACVFWVGLWDVYTVLLGRDIDKAICYDWATVPCVYVSVDTRVKRSQMKIIWYEYELYS